MLSRDADPAVAELIARTVAHGRATGRFVSLCGGMAGGPAALPLLLGCGLRALSGAPPAIGRVKTAIAGLRIVEKGRHG